jgi:predicted HAD superfamily phosphohydrolase YqeG
VGGLATGNSAFSTFFQVAPRLLKVMRHMRPTWHVPALVAVTPAWLRQQGIRGLIWDVDGTLTGDRQPAVLPAADAAFRQLADDPGLRHVVLSNAGEERYRELGAMFPAMPILRAYTLGADVLYRRLQGTNDTWTDAELARRLAEGARVIRKPNAVLVAYALRELACGKGEAVMIGDQYLTDVAGANLGGVRSIKLPTLARETFRTSVRASQVLELGLYRMLHGRTT